MASANRAAAKILKRKMKSERPDDAALLEAVKSAEIIVVDGQYDRVEDVLSAAALSNADREDLANDEDVAKSKGGNIKSAYSSQQMTSDIVVERKRDQKRIRKLYNKRLNEKGAKKGKLFKKGKRVRILKKRGKKVQIRTESGDETWLDAEAIY